ncbi:MAG: G8 domain-containing protein, partial [Pseudomonadota bacterium]
MTITRTLPRFAAGLLTVFATAVAHAQTATGPTAPAQPIGRALSAAAPFVAAPVPAQQITNLCALQPIGGGAPDIVIPDNGQVHEISGNANCGLITVNGTLRCADGVNAVVKMDGMLIMGPNARLECGTASNRFDGNVTFTLRNNRAFPAHPGHGERAFVVMNGGTLDLHGQIRKARFSRLNQDADAGTTSLTTPGLIGWEAGDQIILTTTSTYPDQTELLTLADSCPGGICAVTGALAHFHYGSAPHVYPGAGQNGQDLSVDMRAHIANVERNITIRGADDTYWNSADPKGGHLMIMGGATARIDAVEFNRM